MTFEKGHKTIRKPKEEKILGILELEDFVIEADKFQFFVYNKDQKTGEKKTTTVRYFTDIEALIRHLGVFGQFRALNGIAEMKRLYDNLATDLKKMVDYEIEVRKLRRELI